MQENSSSRTRQIRSFKDWLSVAGCGMLMGMADIVPGISGGTVAFLLGFYGTLLECIKSLNATTLLALCTLQFKTFFHSFNWKFLSALLIGIVFSLINLAHFFNYALGHETYRALLYALFFGLIIAASILYVKRLQRWSVTYILLFLFGLIGAFLLTDPHLKVAVNDPFHLHRIRIFDWWIAACGAMAVCAMLLPGISGSYLLTIFGVYPVVIGALADFTAALKHWTFDGDAFFILTSMMIGIIAGAVVFSRVISWLLKKYHDAAIAFLSGCMVGALRTVWPFYTYRYIVHPLRPDKGPFLQPDSPYFPDLASPLFQQAFLLMTVGVCAVFFIDFLSKRRLRARAKIQHKN